MRTLTRPLSRGSTGILLTVTAVGATGYAYDRNGNLTAFGSNSLGYDAADRWTSGTVSGSSVSFSYDGHGRRVSRTVAASRTDFWYDRTGLTLESGATDATYLRDAGGLLLSVASAGRFENYAHDRLGSTAGLVDTAGGLANRFRYDPWGTPTASSGPAYSGFRFGGVYRDDASGMYRMTQRYYQPGNGRFTQIDPLPQSLISVNRFAYAGCNPSNFMDRTGLDERDAVACAFGAIGGATLAGVGGEIALAAGTAFALGGAAMIASGVGLIAIGAIGIVAGGYLIYEACS